MSEVLNNPGFHMSYGVIQAVVVLLLIRLLDLYERQPLSLLALMAAWGATPSKTGTPSRRLSRRISARPLAVSSTSGGAIALPNTSRASAPGVSAGAAGLDLERHG
jgi:hypothetical protein